MTRTPHPPLTDAQRDLVAAHYRLAFFMATRCRVGAASWEDAAQEASLGMCHSARTFRDGLAQPSTYLAYGARSKINALKKSLARRAARLSQCRLAPATEPAAPEPPDPYPRERIDDALALLRPCDRDLLRRYYLDGTPFKELQREAGVTRQALSMRLSAARGRLRKVMEGAPS